MKTAIVGGGAAGFFLAVCLKELVPGMGVTIFERSQRLLAKVAISGGGRCNCTNTFAGVGDLAAVYPRGHRLMKRLMKGFSQADAFAWFERHGVKLMVQEDQCVFPASQDAQAIVGCLLGEARRHGVEIVTGHAVGDLTPLLRDFDFVAVTAGGQPTEGSLAWLKAAGIETVSPVPSLFTLRIDDESLHALMGTVAQRCVARIPATAFRAEGPLLLTHWGVSGPAVLRLSSYAARHLADRQYRVPLSVSWTGGSAADVALELEALASRHPQKQVLSVHPADVPARLWHHLTKKALGQRAESRWCGLNRKEMNRLTEVLTNDTYQTAGRAPFSDEYVTCGGVALSAVNAATLESRAVARLFFAGEVLDIDGVTGGFNFQAAWTTAHTVATAISRRCLQPTSPRTTA